MKRRQNNNREDELQGQRRTNTIMERRQNEDREGKLQ